MPPLTSTPLRRGGSWTCTALVWWLLAALGAGPFFHGGLAHARPKARTAPAKPPAPAAPPRGSSQSDGPAGGNATPTVVTEVPTEVLRSLDTTPPRRLVVLEFQVQGEEVPRTLLFQLQDGFILGLVRNGVQVIDHEDLPRRLADHPELADCDTSPCLKQIGELLRVRFAVKVEVTVTGNSYRMVARIFGTTGSAPAALPMDTQSRFCDICTVTEARESMLRLADSIRVPDEPSLDDMAKAAVTPQSRYLPSLQSSAVITGIGVLAISIGTAMLIVAAPTDKGTAALGGAFMGLGLGGTLFGVYGLAASWHQRDPAPPASAPPPGSVVQR